MTNISNIAKEQKVFQRYETWPFLSRFQTSRTHAAINRNQRTGLILFHSSKVLILFFILIFFLLIWLISVRFVRRSETILERKIVVTIILQSSVEQE